MSELLQFSPLRYPGGKKNFVPFFLNVFEKSNLNIKAYYEFYAGGAGAALQLLLNGHVNTIHLNDADYHIYSFWYSILNQTEEFLKKIADIDITIDEWKKQRAIYENYNKEGIFNIGFSTFFLNRTNRSGILVKAGPIGGKMQNGNYKIDVRFNKKNLSTLIEKIATNREKIFIYNSDAIALMKKQKHQLKQKSSFLFLDPPYFEKGKDLYLNFYHLQNHIDLKLFLEKNKTGNWILSYDNCRAIFRLYRSFPKRLFQINYSLQDKKKAKEIVIFSDSLLASKNHRKIFINGQKAK